MAASSFATGALLIAMVVGAWTATWAGLAAMIATGRGLPWRFGAIRGALAGPIGAPWTLAATAPSAPPPPPQPTPGGALRRRELRLAILVVAAFGTAAWSVSLGWVQGFSADQTAAVQERVAGVSERAAQIAENLEPVENNVVAAAVAGGAVSTLADSLLDSSRFTEISGLAIPGLGWVSLAGALGGVLIALTAALTRRGPVFVIVALVAASILTFVAPTAFAIQWLNFRAIPGVDRLPDAIRFYIPDPRIGPGLWLFLGALTSVSVASSVAAVASRQRRIAEGTGARGTTAQPPSG